MFLLEDFKHQRNIYQSKTTIVPGFRECGGGEGWYENDKVLSSKTLRRRGEGATSSVAGDKRNQMRQKFLVFFSMGSKQTNKQKKKFLAFFSVGDNKTIKFLIFNLFHVSEQTNNKQTKKFLASFSVGDNKTINFLIVNLFHVSKQTNNKQTNKQRSSWNPSLWEMIKQ